MDMTQVMEKFLDMCRADFFAFLFKRSCKGQEDALICVLSKQDMRDNIALVSGLFVLQDTDRGDIALRSRGTSGATSKGKAIRNRGFAREYLFETFGIKRVPYSTIKGYHKDGDSNDGAAFERFYAALVNGSKIPDDGFDFTVHADVLMPNGAQVECKIIDGGARLCKDFHILLG